MAIALTGLLLATVVTSLALSIGTGAPDRLPAIALSSPAILHLQRALVAAFVVGVLSVFLLRAAFGYFPQKVSTTGAEWPSVAVADVEQRTATADERLTKEMDDLGAGLADLAETTDALIAAITKLHPDVGAVLEQELRPLRDRPMGG